MFSSFNRLIIKDKCEENLDGVKASIDMLRQFNSQLNRFALTAEEHYAIHGFARNEHSKEFEKGTLKENGLQCHKEDVRLNDAIATYGRLKDIHAKRPFFFFLFHPNQNSKEKEAIEYMRNILKNNYKFTDAELVASPVFRKFDNELLHQTNRITIAQTELNKVLGDGIPATSFAAGANETGGVADNYNYNSYMANVESWPRFSRENGVKQLLWHHSDIKNIAYYFVYPFFEQLVSEGD
mgnify:CR=1 FL=1